jgi:hypothetical protein
MDLGTFLLGVGTGVIANIAFSALIFSNSVAKRRVSRTENATKEFIRAIETERNISAELRNRYRYSLSVFIDTFVNTWGYDGMNSFNPQMPLPHIADVGENEDRWQRFDFYVRPVINDLSGFMFVSVLRWLRFPAFIKLHRLTELCIQIEDAVMQLDAACVNSPIVQLDEAKGVINIVNSDDPRYESLISSFCKLHEKWKQWVKVSRPRTRLFFFKRRLGIK